ncbi:unnamed protein product [Ranitomeya imitator]|uniref:Uncharacterized protein n=1 Tax=Ranitomeya imitator TaxID=111125 RepID=A0ABN9LNR7_9NEOB|nr:unnamed protein product [Ranitomeya imitator]
MGKRTCVIVPHHHSDASSPHRHREVQRIQQAPLHMTGSRCMRLQIVPSTGGEQRSRAQRWRTDSGRYRYTKRLSNDHDQRYDLAVIVGNIGGLSTALQNAVDKPLMPTNVEFFQFKSCQVDYQVTENFKHSNALRSVSEFTDLSRRTPKKQLISEKVIDVQSVGHTDPSDLLNTAVIEDAGNLSEHPLETPNKTRQLKITKFVTPIKKQGRYLPSTCGDNFPLVIEKTFTEEKREGRDILKDMFPYESSTPTGISASCRRPIKGAAGRPFSVKDFKDYKLDESYSTKYISKYHPVIEEKPTKGKSERSIPIWIKLLILLILAVLSFLVYQAMESNEGNPIMKWFQGNQNLSKDEN